MRSKILRLVLLLACQVSAITFPEEAKVNNQWADSVHRTLTLVFPIDAAHYAIPPDSIVEVYAWGSMSEYQSAVPACRMTLFSEDSCFYKTFSYDEIARPGDSGQPEFEFFVRLLGDSTVYYTPDMMRCEYDHRIMFHNSITPVLIVLPGGPSYMSTDWDELAQRAVEAAEIRPLSDYQLEDSVDQHRLSNFRLTAGTKNLYRSFHPYYPTKPGRDTEGERLRWVDILAEQVGVRSVICLCDDKTYALGREYVCGGETYTVAMPSYYQTIIDSGDICYVPVSTQHAYYYPEIQQFAEWIRDVVLFINDESHPLPMQIHCALGADRTGVVCAVLSALCGAEWQNIMADYFETSNMKAQLYRHPNRLRYVFSRLTGLNPDACTSAQLSAAVRAHFVDAGVLTDAQIDRMVQRLTQAIPAGQMVPTDDMPARVATYDILGRNVTPDHHGFQLRVDEQGHWSKCLVTN